MGYYVEKETTQRARRLYGDAIMLFKEHVREEGAAPDDLITALSMLSESLCRFAEKELRLSDNEVDAFCDELLGAMEVNLRPDRHIELDQN